ncbi:mCG58716, partial [Mus musculus]
RERCVLSRPLYAVVLWGSGVQTAPDSPSFQTLSCSGTTWTLAGSSLFNIRVDNSAPGGAVPDAGAHIPGILVTAFPGRGEGDHCTPWESGSRHKCQDSDPVEERRTSRLDCATALIRLMTSTRLSLRQGVGEEAASQQNTKAQNITEYAINSGMRKFPMTAHEKFSL